MNTNWNDPNFQGFGRQPRPKRERHAVGTPVGRTLLNIAVTLVFAAVYFYVVLPPISLKSEDFYVFVLLVCAVYGGCAILTSGFQGTGVKGYFGFLKKQCTVPLVVAAALVVTALVGAVIAVEFSGRIVSVASLVGFVTVIGFTIRNGLLLVGRYRELAAEGRPSREAVELGSRERMVPILMTSLTTVFGLVPIAAAYDLPGGELLAPLAAVQLGGLIVATLAALVALPALARLMARD